MDPVGPDETEPASDDDSEKRRFAAFGRVDSSTKFVEVRRRLVDLTDPEFDLKGSPTITGVDNRVDFQASLIAVVEDLAVERLGIDAHVSDNERLKEETERVQVRFEARRRRPHRGRSQGRIGKVALRRRPQLMAGS